MTENYGHVIADALSLSIPTIISNNTPWKVDGIFAEIGLVNIDNNNIQKYRESINYINGLDQNEYNYLRSRTNKTYQRFIKDSDNLQMTKKIFE